MTTAKGFVVPADGGKHFAMMTPGRSAALKLLGRETDETDQRCQRYRWEILGPNPL